VALADQWRLVLFWESEQLTVNAPYTGGTSAVVASSFAYGTAAGLVGNTTKQSIDIATGQQKKGFDVEELVLNTGFSAATAGFTQWALPSANIAGLTVGRNSFNAIGQSMITKATNNTIQNISYSTGAKMAAGAQAADLYRALAGALADLSRALAGLVASNNGAKTSQ
jgi:type VI secretion system secreted protein VgrG